LTSRAEDLIFEPHCDVVGCDKSFYRIAGFTEEKGGDRDASDRDGFVFRLSGEA
jgi:hypothetical protein